jgi:hypothetical protein
MTEQEIWKVERPGRYIQAYLDEPETPDEVAIAREMSRDALAEEPWGPA